jgi:ABC-type glycerol-3-phosphate transport system permease component
LVLHLLLVAGGLFVAVPLLWMVVTSLKGQLSALAFPPSLLPNPAHWDNYAEVFRQIPLARYFLNTVFVAGATVLGVLVTSTLAAYAFSFLRFKGSRMAFLLVLGTMMVPPPAYLVPGYRLLSHLGWVDTYWALIIPWIANAFAIFLLRQHMKTIPRALYDSARLEGASDLAFLVRVVLPLSRPVLAAAALFAFLGSWNSFIWPLAMTERESLRVLQVGLAYFSTEASAQWPLLMAGSTLAILPVVFVYLLAQKQIVATFQETGLGG